MIRVDYKYNDEFVNTTFVHEDDDKHSMMGRLTFTRVDFEEFRYDLMHGGTIHTRYKFE